MGVLTLRPRPATAAERFSLPDGRFLVFVFGEGEALGLGVDSDEAWPKIVARREALRRGVSADDLCVQNFAEPGASNSAIARRVVTECGAVQPDLVLVQFTQHRRTEAYSDGSTFAVGPWLDDEPAGRAVDDGRTPPVPREREQRDRGRAFLRFCDETQGLYQSVRDVLLVQSTLASHGIEGVALTRDPESYRRPGAISDAVLGPLLGLIDEKFFALEASVASLPEPVDRRGDGPLLGLREHAAIAETVYRHLERNRLDEHGERAPMDHAQAVAQVTRTVKSFYSELPFNYHGTVESAIDAIRHPTIAQNYPDLDAYLREAEGDRSHPDGRLGLSVLEVGCGAGWLTHGLAHHYSVDVHAIDLTPSALERAREIAPLVGTEGHVRFEECNVFEFTADEPFDLVVSLGVLHHTGDARAAFDRIVECLAPGGSLYLGLYHAPGRRVFLDEMARIADADGEEAAFDRYRSLDRVHADDETLARSWFRDQVLHPHETQHTLAEILEWFDDAGLELLSTSINRFAPLEARERLIEREREYEALSRRALFEENRYFPGFFTAFARREE